MSFKESNRSINILYLLHITGLVVLCTAELKIDNSVPYVKYILFTPNNTDDDDGCLLEPTLEALQKCPLDPNVQTIFIIHGYHVLLKPGDNIHLIKTKLLEIGQYNVIILNWEMYSRAPYEQAWRNTFRVADELVELVNFLQENAGIDPKNVRMIGHSLGAHLAGIAGRNISNLGIINGLDPAGPEFPKEEMLSYKDAKFVQVIHTSSYEDDFFSYYETGIHLGYGTKEELGHIDFYVNGGVNQPNCIKGRKYQESPLVRNITVSDEYYQSLCNHDISINYFLESLNNTECYFRGTFCRSYSDFKIGKCPVDRIFKLESPVTAEMGFYGKEVPNLWPHSRFFLKTLAYPPYCLNDGIM